MEWIRSETRPDKDCVVWVIHNYYFPFSPLTATYSKYNDVFMFGPCVSHLPALIPLNITHWMPLPPIPD